MNKCFWKHMSDEKWVLLKKSDEYNRYNFLKSYSMEGKVSINNV